MRFFSLHQSGGMTNQQTNIAISKTTQLLCMKNISFKSFKRAKSVIKVCVRFAH